MGKRPQVDTVLRDVKSFLEHLGTDCDDLSEHERERKAILRDVRRVLRR